MCVYTWDGDEWLGNDACPLGQHCDKPNYTGSYIGEQATTQCEGP